jgi:hypothetical protein
MAVTSAKELQRMASSGELYQFFHLGCWMNIIGAGITQSIATTEVGRQGPRQFSKVLLDGPVSD